MKPRTFSAAATALATLTAGAFVLVPSAAHAGPLGAGETVLSGTTTPSGVGAASVAKVPGQSTYVAVWEGDRAVTTGTQQGIKREIFGRYVSSTGTPLGSPTRLISLGAAEDATLDATDPVVTTLSNGMLAVVYSGDVISDTAGGPTPVDTTSFQIEAATIDPTQALGALTPVTITTPGSPADPAFDQIHADATDDHGQLRIVWSGDTAATGDGQMEVWTTRVANGLTGTPTVQQVSTGHPTGSAYDNTYPRVAASAAGNGPDAVVVWEGVDSLNPGPVRRIRAARVTSTPGTSARLTSAPATSTTEELEPDIATAASGYQVVWSGNTGGAGYQLSSASLNAAGAPGTPTTITAGHHDTWPSVVFDPSQPGQYAVAWARRTSTAGTGHYELQTGRWAPASATPWRLPSN